MAIRLALISANRHCDPYPVYPLGTAYLKSYLLSKIEDCIVDIVDMNLTSYDELRKYLLEQKPNYIGLSLRNLDGANSLRGDDFLSYYKELTDLIRLHSSAPLIIGGSAFSIAPNEFMNLLKADYGIKGEGEGELYDLIISLEEKKEKISRPPSCRYIARPTVYFEPHLVEYYWKQSGMLNIQTKRGCPYNCIYCTYPEIDGRTLRTVDIDSIIDTMARSKRDYGVNYWFFTDSVFNISPDYNNKLAEDLVKSDLNISWGAYFTPSNINDEQLKLFKRSGLTHIEYGTESFCDSTLAAYGKRFTFSEVLEASELALKHNIYYSHFMILGGWKDDMKAIEETMNNSKYLRHTVIFPFVGMRIYPNTVLQKHCIKAGVLEPDNKLLNSCYYTHPYFDLEQARSMARATGKAWIFPDEEQPEMMNKLKIQRNKKGPLWEYLRKP